MKLVVWFPGLGSFANVTGNILEYFEKDLDTDVICVSYSGYGRDGFRKAAERLSGPLAGMVAGYDQVYFLGHSMGGDVAETLVSFYGFTPAKVVTIGTPPKPFKYLPKLFSGVLGDYSGEAVYKSDIPLLRIYGEYDLLGNPLSPLFHPPKREKANVVSVEVANHTHLSILWSGRAAAEIYSFCTYT